MCRALPPTRRCTTGGGRHWSHRMRDATVVDVPPVYSTLVPDVRGSARAQPLINHARATKRALKHLHLDYRDAL